MNHDFFIIECLKLIFFPYFQLLFGSIFGEAYKWKKYSTYSEARVYGYISDVNQDGTADYTKQLQFNTSSGPAETGTVKELKQKISVSTKTKSGWINGYHYGAGGISHTSTLTW
jgi:hypothetical protein